MIFFTSNMILGWSQNRLCHWKLMVILQEFGWYTEKAFGFSPKWLVSRYIPVARASNPDTRPRHLRASRSHPRDLNVPLPSRLAIDAHSHCTHSDIWHYNFLAVDIRQQDPDRNNVEKCSNDELWRDGPEGSSPTVVCSGNPRAGGSFDWWFHVVFLVQQTMGCL